MAEQQSAVAKSVKSVMAMPEIQEKFRSMLGERMQGFFVSVSNCVAGNELLKKADPNSIVMAAGVAASLDLPIDPNLGFAYIVPYGGSAQFQIGYRGLVQLAQRSGVFETINVTEVREGEIGKEDFLTGEIEFSWKPRAERVKLPVVGYVAYFRLTNGFVKNFYMSKQEAESHGKRFSQTYKKGFGNWKDDFDAMAKKTVLKLLLSKYAPLSIQMQRAVVADQGVVKDVSNDAIDVDYVDHSHSQQGSLNIGDTEIDKEKKRVSAHIAKAKTVASLEEVKALAEEHGLLDEYEKKITQLELEA